MYFIKDEMGFVTYTVPAEMVGYIDHKERTLYLKTLVKVDQNNNACALAYDTIVLPGITLPLDGKD
jgi:hypothetical protein